MDRTLLASVLFADIINYSSQSVDIQISWKDFFNRSLTAALRPVKVDNRVILDTGDGAAVCFLAAPEIAVRCAIALQRDFAHALTHDKDAPRIRLGINLGPVRLMHDLNGNLNVLGDGINVGQRIMSFAGVNQILVSRSYFEVVAWISDDFKRLFHSEAVHHDKHQREHIVYSVGTAPAPATPPPPPPAVRLQPSVLEAVEHCLAKYAGPIAPHMIHEALGQITTADQLCSLLAQKAVPVSDRAVFLKRCHEALAPELWPVSMTPIPARQGFDTAFLDELKSALAQYVGPLSRVMVDRAVTRAASRDELYRLVAEGINSEKDRKAFLSSRV